MELSPLFVEAFEYAAALHAGQQRKGSSTPYISHLMAVSALALEHGGGEDEAIAALLHDAVEDQGGAPVLEQIRMRFGDAVAGIVEGCTDADTIPKPPWRPRKEAYLAHLQNAPPSVRLVSCADKLHNARSILCDYRQAGEAVWARFTGGRDQTLWYYRSLIVTFRNGGPSVLAEELARTVSELEILVARGRT
ncbi:MAG: HD domain-containing protein [Bryobacteraceae bacterium]